MQDINNNGAKNIAQFYKNYGVIKTHGLIKTQKKNLKFIKQVYAKALAIKDKEMDKNFFLPVHFEWICDNYYIIEREIKNICKSLAYTGKLPASRDYNNKSEIRIYAVARELTRNFKGELTGETLERFFEQSQNNFNNSNNNGWFSINELALARIMIAAAICTEIYNICLDLWAYLNKNISKLSEEYAHSLGLCIKNLRFCTVYKFENLFTKCSRTEEIFNSDPANVYKNLDKQTKDYYRKRLSEIARENNCSEAEIANNIYNQAIDARNKFNDSNSNLNENEKIMYEKKSHIGYYLLKKSSGMRLYFFGIISLSVIFFAIACRICGVAGIFLALPLWEFAKQIVEFVFARTAENTPLPKLELASVPDDKKVLVCVTTLLFGEGKDDNIFERLEVFYNANADKNINFAILGDFKDNKARETAEDNKIIAYAEKKINELNEKYNNSFCLFIRPRVYSKTEKRFMGWERKRGALLELVRFIKSKNNYESNDLNRFNKFIGDLDFIRDVKYIITLDADTNLSIDSAKEMLAAMLHPNAKPIFDERKKIVVDGYGIMQPRMGAELKAASKTGFTRMLCGCGGVDIYQSAAYDLYQEISGEGNFCGKGIFDVDIFYKAIDKAYPEESVLSHDLLEGTRLRCALISDLELTDGIPKNPASYFDRNHRWIRGDVQALAFAGARVKNAENKFVKNNITNFSRYKIYENVRRAILPVATVCAIICAIVQFYLGYNLNAASAFVFAGLYIVFPMITGLLSIAFISSLQNISKRFSSKVMTSIWQSFCGILFDFASLAYRAVLSLDAILRSLWRMFISRRKLLSWVTASEGEAKLSGLALYARKMFIPALLGLAFIIFAPLGSYKILGAMWLIFPVAAYIMGREDKNISNIERKIGAKTQVKLENYIADMWKFYNNTVNKHENYLPPDNVQLYPAENIAHRTSPTNIGLYLLSVLCARDFGLIDDKNMIIKIENTVNTIERLEKWHGHLYNWYDNKSLKIIGSRFISTVDSGNFAACLTALKEGLKEYDNCENIINRIEKILDETKFGELYNNSRDLFYIGYDADSNSFGENCYDLYMSEAKITSYFAIARREVPKKHWSKLGRTLIKSNGYMGLASWTGTAFEYFMPNLLLPLSKNSLTYEAHKFALREQIKRGAKYNGTEVWGISESGFYAFDFDMNYQYQAFGVQKLGLKRGLNKEHVISPYSSFLALSVAPNYAAANLARLEKIGMYGKYGFFEAADFTSSRVGAGMSVVRSYMAHHVGMSIIAAANATRDNIFQKRYMRDVLQKSAAEILQEKIPVDAIIFEDINSREVPEKINRSYGVIEKNAGIINLENPACRIISNSHAKISASSSGDILLEDGAIALNYADFERYNNLRQLSVLFRYKDKYSDEVFSHSKKLLFNEGAEYEYDFSDYKASFGVKKILSNDSKHVLVKTNYMLAPDCSCFIIDAEIRANNVKNMNKKNANNNKYSENNCEIMLYFEPILARIEDYKAHPAFAALSVECEYDEKSKILYYKRRPRLETEAEKWIAICVCNKNKEENKSNNKSAKNINLNLSFESRRDDILLHNYSQNDIKNLFDLKFSNSSGACINPVCAIKIGAENEFVNNVEFYISSASSKEEAMNILNSVKIKNRENENKKLEEECRNRLLVSGVKSRNLLDIILSCAYCKTLNNKPEINLINGLSGLNSSVKMMWKCGISGDLPMVLVIIRDEEKSEIFEEYIHAHKYLTACGFKFDLIAMFSEPEKYSRPLKNKLNNLIKKNCSARFLNQKGGIFLLEESGLENEQIVILNALACYKYDTNSIKSLPEKEALESLPEIINNVDYDLKNEKNIKYKNFKFDESFYDVSGGYFSQNLNNTENFNFYIDCKNKLAPWSHLLVNRQFGTLITHKSLGFTWCGNAREKRITPWENDPVLGMSGEKLILNLINSGKKYDLCACASHLKIAPNFAEYYGKLKIQIENSEIKLEYKINVSVDEKLFVKLVDFCCYLNNENNINNLSNILANLEICYLIKPIMGVSANKSAIIYVEERSNEILSFGNICSGDFKSQGFLRAINGEIKAKDYLEFISDGRKNANENDYICVSKNLSFSKENLNNNFNNFSRAVFALGCYSSEKYYNFVNNKLSDENFINNLSRNSQIFINKFMPKFKINTKNKALEPMFNTFVPFQNIAGRIFGRTGFYQSSGAFGFRDQIQDMAAMIYAAPELVKAHIFRACAHQFEEGDVQHWWHNIKPEAENKAHRGVRTRCSDDYLWLPYICAFYAECTNDYSFLDKKIRYIKDFLLENHERERYGEPFKSDLSESVYAHCIKACDYGLKFGTHNLPLIGTCDWNDGMSLVGAEGKGESVWLAFFMRLVFEKFIKICEYKKDFAHVEKYKKVCEDLNNAIENNCFEQKSGQYIRGFYDNGEKLGSNERDECKIDILPQAFAAILNHDKSDITTERAKISMNNAYNNLFDKEHKILKLFTPPFINGSQNPGYIKGYVAGIRENGGQYTHGAIWGALGMFALGERERGLEIINAINPAERCANPELARIYRVEPYVLAGDVYANSSHEGRGGWSWYTGSAAWFWRVVYENLL